MKPLSCRLCNAATYEQFQLPVLERYDVRYFLCSGCQSLQTEKPYWLGEAYGSSHLGVADVGAGQRIVRNSAVVLAMQRVLGFSRVLDFGGSDGLLCRLLRDRGLDAYVDDEYAFPVYAQTFRGKLAPGYDLVTAFEVLEHLVNPVETFQSISAASPNYFLASTELYSDQGKNWWYLAPHTGQHVFLYSRRALELAGSRHGYTYYQINELHLFSKRPLPRLKIKLLRRITAGRIFQLFRASLPFTESWQWVERDFNMAKEAAKSTLRNS